jgi:prophage regulatory protein
MSVGQAAELTTFSKQQLRLMAKRDLFPQPIQLSARRVAFIEAEVLDWLRNRQSHRPTPVAWQSIADGNEVSATA